MPIAQLQKQLLADGAVLGLGIEHHNRALAIIRHLYAPPLRTGLHPWARPEPKSWQAQLAAESA